MKSFTRNYEDNSTEAGFQFTFYCDLCHDGFKSSFVESDTYKKHSMLRNVASGASLLGGLFGNRANSVTWGVERGSTILSERFTGMSPEWQKEHEQCFARAQNEVQRHFHRCENCRQWICVSDFNEEEGLCVSCAPRTNVAIAKARADKMIRDIEDIAEKTTVFRGAVQTKTIVCPTCQKPCGNGNFCNHCGSSLAMKR